MEILELKYSKMLCASGDEPGYDGPADPEDPNDQPD